MNTLYFKIYCSACGGGIEFPAYAIGEQASCPHCHIAVALVFPSGPTDNATKSIASYLQSSRFPTKRAELLLLRQFANFPTCIEDLGGIDVWRTALGSKPDDIVKCFIEQAMLQDGSSDLLGLLQTKSDSDLRGLAKSRGLGTSGTKQTLAKRLLKKVPEGLRKLFIGKTYLICTQKGRLLVDEFLESENDLKAQAKQASMSALFEQKLNDACLVVASFEAQQVFSRGLGIDWKNYNACRDMSVLKRIFSRQLQRHASFTSDVVLRLRVSAAMMHLWGTNKPPALFPNVERNWDVESRMILFSALESIRLQEMKQAGVQRVKVLGSGLPNACSTCKLCNGKTYGIDEVPVLPHENCTCENGCGCLLIAHE